MKALDVNKSGEDKEPTTNGHLRIKVLALLLVSIVLAFLSCSGRTDWVENGETRGGINHSYKWAKIRESFGMERQQSTIPDVPEFPSSVKTKADSVGVSSFRKPSMAAVRRELPAEYSRHRLRNRSTVKGIRGMISSGSIYEQKSPDSSQVSSSNTERQLMMNRRNKRRKMTAMISPSLILAGGVAAGGVIVAGGIAGGIILAPTFAMMSTPAPTVAAPTRMPVPAPTQMPVGITLAPNTPPPASFPTPFPTPMPTPNLTPPPGGCPDPTSQTERIVSGAKFDYGFFGGTTIREPTDEEVAGLVAQTERFYTDLFLAQYRGAFSCVSLGNVLTTFDATSGT